VLAEQSGWLNGIRLVTKNILAARLAPSGNIQWLMSYLVIPLRAPVLADEGDRVRVTFQYRPGDEIHVLTNSARAQIVGAPLAPPVPARRSLAGVSAGC
jgi:hypothetical protein